jgi:hypothetical protein
MWHPVTTDGGPAALSEASRLAAIAIAWVGSRRAMLGVRRQAGGRTLVIGAELPRSRSAG